MSWAPRQGGRHAAGLARDGVAAHVGGALARRYADVRARTERLAEPLSAEDQTLQSMPDAARPSGTAPTPPGSSRPSCSRRTLPGYRPHHPDYGYLFNSYYETVGPRHPRPARGLLSRPSVAEIARYRGHVDAAMPALIAAADSGVALAAPLIELGLHHEEQHQELILMDIKHVLSLNPLQPAYRRAAPLSALPALPLRLARGRRRAPADRP